MVPENDSFTETTTTSWGSRLGNSFKGILTGLVIIAAATCLLYWNEGRTVQTGDAIAEAQLAAVAMPSADSVDPSFNGKLIHVTAPATTQDIVQDDLFGVKTNAIAVKREVEYYQWVESSRQEKRKKMGGGEETITTYSYNKQWVPTPVDSSRFRQPANHTNTVRVSAKNAVFYAPRVSLGAYTLPEFLVRSIRNAQPLPTGLSSEDCQRLQQRFFPDTVQERIDMTPPQTGALGDQQGAYIGMVNTLQRAASAMNAGAPAMVHANINELYLGRSSVTPAVGDVRIRFTMIPQGGVVSILAKVNSDTFEHFMAKNGKKFSRLSMGTVSMDNMFSEARSDNNMMAWILRVLGIFMAIVGFKMVLAPLSVLADVIPILGTIVGAGTGFVGTLLGVAWSFIVIAIAWIRFRPVFAFSLIGIAVLLLIIILVKGRLRKAPAAA